MVDKLIAVSASLKALCNHSAILDQCKSFFKDSHLKATYANSDTIEGMCRKEILVDKNR